MSKLKSTILHSEHYLQLGAGCQRHGLWLTEGEHVWARPELVPLVQEEVVVLVVGAEVGQHEVQSAAQPGRGLGRGVVGVAVPVVVWTVSLGVKSLLDIDIKEN